MNDVIQQEVHPFKIAVSGVKSDGSEVPPTTIPVRCLWTGDIEVWPSAFAIGSQNMGSSVEETLTIASRSGKTYEILECVGEPELAASWKLDSASSERQVLRLFLSILRKSSVNTQLKIRLRCSSDGRETTLRVPVSYFGQ
ncbi:MAG: hypothetical protein WD669_09105 [Pirellulales bacterium]